METTDQIISNVLRGEQHAFRVLVNEYQDLVFTICLKIVKNRESAEEAAQDVFIKVYKKLHQFDRQSSLKTWIYRIAYRTAIDYYRKKTPESVDPETALRPIGSKDTPADMLLEADDRSRSIAMAMSKLRPKDAEVLNLFYLEELDINEIGSIMKLTKSNVKVRLHRARQRLGEQLLSINITHA